MSFGTPTTVPGHPSPFFGFVDTTDNAFRLVLAAQRGLVPRIAQRLRHAELKEMITNGAIFVFSVEESGMKRWRDGLFWSPSRIDGNFLVYKEMNPVGEGRSSREEWLSSSSQDPNGGLKVGGLNKRTITVKVEGHEYHVISYYRPEDVDSGRLNVLSNRADIMALDLPQHLFRMADYRVPPQFTTPSERRSSTPSQGTEPTSLYGYTPSAGSGHASHPSDMTRLPDNSRAMPMHHDYTAAYQTSDASAVDYDTRVHRAPDVAYDDTSNATWPSYSNSEGAALRVRGDITQLLPDRTTRSATAMQDNDVWNSLPYRPTHTTPAAAHYQQRGRHATTSEFGDTVLPVSRRFTAPPYPEYEVQEQWPGNVGHYQGAPSSLPSSLEASTNAAYYPPNYNSDHIPVNSDHAAPAQYSNYYPPYNAMRGDCDFPPNNNPFDSGDPGGR
ncbi:hypothetical protein HWV62_37783 [Athelia sp. TMB]|nr:hypothetical protein HWV62_37783 [Athelia sp. TMB]